MVIVASHQDNLWNVHKPDLGRLSTFNLPLLVSANQDKWSFAASYNTPNIYRRRCDLLAHYAKCTDDMLCIRQWKMQVGDYSALLEFMEWVNQSYDLPTQTQITWRSLHLWRRSWNHIQPPKALQRVKRRQDHIKLVLVLFIQLFRHLKHAGVVCYAYEGCPVTRMQFP